MALHVKIIETHMMHLPTQNDIFRHVHFYIDKNYESARLRPLHLRVQAPNSVVQLETANKSTVCRERKPYARLAAVTAPYHNTIV